MFDFFFSTQFVLVAGCWTVYKFWHPLNKLVKVPKPKKMGTYRSTNKARVETYKDLAHNHGGEVKKPIEDTDEFGKFWVIEVVTTAFQIIFVPVPADPEDEC